MSCGSERKDVRQLLSSKKEQQQEAVGRSADETLARCTGDLQIRSCEGCRRLMRGDEWNKQPRIQI